MIETMGFKFSGGNLRGDAVPTPINHAEIIPRRRDGIVGDFIHIHVKRGSQAVETAEQTIVVKMEIVWPERPPRFPVIPGRRPRYRGPGRGRCCLLAGGLTTR